MNPDVRPVLILGGGINGTAIARELILRHVPVVLVEAADIAYGATSRSSRLIHGGLRYLEYGEFDLVSESLGERKRLLKLAPHLVRPLRLHTPAHGRLGGFAPAMRRFFGMPSGSHSPRGMWLIRIGLWMYEAYAADPDRRGVAVNRPGEGEAPLVDQDRYRWVCSYDDGQALWPERMALEWLEDAATYARREQIPFAFFNRTVARLEGAVARLATSDHLPGQPVETTLGAFSPRLVINATGSWVDRTLQRLHTDSKRLIGGTKGSHLLLANERLSSLLRGDGVYAEAADGRPVFLLPMDGVSLIGTTDIPYDGPPGEATATADEIDYLLEATNRVFPTARATGEQVVAHYAGVRPLPHVDADKPGAITRRHSLHHHDGADPPMFSVIGGKLTTCRSLAEEAADWVLANHGEGGRKATTISRPTPGGWGHPPEDELESTIERIAEDSEFPRNSVRAVWRLYGVRTTAVLRHVASYGQEARQPIDPVAAPYPIGLARYVVEHEWARSLEDIVERRLFLIHAPKLRRDWLCRIAQFSDIETETPLDERLERCEHRLRELYGRTIEE